MIEVDDNIFFRRLRRLTPLSDAEIDTLEPLLRRTQRVAADRMLVADGAEPEDLHILLSGWAAKQKVRRDGGRQITALHVPGDVCDIDGLYVASLDYAVVTLTECKIATVPRRHLLNLFDHQPGLFRVFTWLALVDNAVLTTWLMMIGRARAQERLAHLLCELKARLKAVGLADDEGYTLPLTQEELGDATGLTAVHVNRMLGGLRQDGLLTTSDRRVAFKKPKQLEGFASFTPAYLHIGGMRI